ncbi:lecithin-cholesterol acyltransferase-like 1 [Lolium rigidum]|uniref:lecithin-cholesterol acyltransferase-like 1 n=1 Tax=Lolium rigidum TaxID=89674 RepID=UPI001F5C1F3E|nr:lecithin-cholesterol acyltransferase-like 1 [Lolium rigidum]
MAKNTVFLGLLQLLPLLLPPSLRDYLWAAPSDHDMDQQLEVYHPIILQGGFSCSVLEARLTDAYTPSLPHCGALKGKGWFPLWNNTSDVVDHDYMPCFEEQMSLVFDPAINDYRNQPGVETRVANFGSVYGFSYKDESCPFCCNVKIRNELEALGYQDGVTLFGAPYDIRYAPPQPGQCSKVYSDYFARVKDLVQHASEKNANKPVIFRVLPTNMRVEAPMVPTTYLNGVGIQTTKQVVYWDGNFDVSPENVYGNGDGVVNWISVLAFAKELKRQHYSENIFFKFVKIPNATHGDITIQDNSLKIVMAEILEANS